MYCYFNLQYHLFNFFRFHLNILLNSLNKIKVFLQDRFCQIKENL